MIYSIRYTPAAMRDMDHVRAEVYEASKDPEIANRYVNQFIEKIEEKQLFPSSGKPLRYQGLFTGFYYLLYKKYFAFYRVNGNYIEVIRIIMAKRDYVKILFGDSDDSSE